MINDKIRDLLKEFQRDNKAIIELSKYDIDLILNVAFELKMYDVILDLFKPLEIDGEVIMFFDIFSYLSPLNNNLAPFLNRFDVSDEEKEKIVKSFYDIDMDKVGRMKVGNSLPREISGWGHPVLNVNDVIYYAEPACLKSMIYCFNNNIRTTMNDAECVSGEATDNGVCCLWIDYDALSNENREYADSLIEAGKAHFVDKEHVKTICIEIPCSKDETINEVSQKLEALVNGFVKQPILYGFWTRDAFLIKMRDIIRKGILYGSTIPFSDDTYDEICYQLIDNGTVKENSNGDVSIDDGKLFLLDDFIDEILKYPNLFQILVDYYMFYYDQEEDKVWESEKLFNRYKESLDESISKGNNI